MNLVINALSLHSSVKEQFCDRMYWKIIDSSGWRSLPTHMAIVSRVGENIWGGLVYEVMVNRLPVTSAVNQQPLPLPRDASST